MSATTTLVDTQSARPVTGAAVRWRGRLIDALPALLAYFLVRAIALVVLWLFAQGTGADFWYLLYGRFDAGWYRQIADHGYNLAIPLKPDGSLKTSNLAFFPLYPLLIVLLASVTPLSTAVAGLVVSWAAGPVGAWGIYAVGRHLHSRLTGIMLATLWGVLPHALVESLAYSESLFTALAAWSLYALLRRQWLTAGALCLFAGLTRPTANALIAAVGLTALVAIVRRQDGWRPWVSALIAPLGYLGFLAWVGHRLGRLDGYTYMQREAWGVYFDGGPDTLLQTKRILTHDGQKLGWYVIVFLVALAIALLALALMDRYPLPVLVYSVVTVLFVIGAAGGYQGKARYLVPAFTLLLPVATALAQARLRTRLVVLTFLTLISAWYGVYLTLVWGSSP